MRFYFIFRKQRKSFLTICKTTNVFFLKLIPNFNGKRRKMQHWLLKINLHPCLWAYFAVNGSYDANRLTESVKKQIHGCCGAFIAIVIHMKTEMKTWLTSHLSLPNDITRKELSFFSRREKHVDIKLVFVIFFVSDGLSRLSPQSR